MCRWCVERFRHFQKIFFIYYNENATIDIEDLYNSYCVLPKIFSPYQIKLLQFYTNEVALQSRIDTIGVT